MVRIFVEGKGDEKFIETYLEFMSSNFELKKYETIKAGGWTKLDKIDNQFKENTDSGGTNLVVFDADSPEKKGGFKRRKAALNAQKKALNIEFELFLFPNQSDDGDFELLLENVINNKHSNILTCFEEYENCLRNLTDAEGNQRYSLPMRKAKIYSYIDAFHKSSRQNEKFKKGDYFFGNSDFWNLKSGYLNPLKTFLLVQLKI